MNEETENQINVEELLAPSKRQLREKVKADVEAFLKAGGEYTDCPNLDLRKYSNKKKRRV